MKRFVCLTDYIKSFPTNTLFREVWHRHDLKDIGKYIFHTDFPDRALKYLGYSMGLPPHSPSKKYLMKWIPLPDDKSIMTNFAHVFNQYNCYTTLNYYSAEVALKKAELIIEDEKLRRMQSMPQIFSPERIQHQQDKILSISEGLEGSSFVDLAFDFDIDPDKAMNTFEKAIKNTLKLASYFEDRYVENQMYFSGGRGFHVVVPYSSYGQRKASNNHLVNRHMAELIDLEVGPLQLDYAIYSSRRQLRMVNTYHQSSGLRKVALTRHDLELGKKHILTLAR
ncbi:MAG: hypothetical protein H8E18_04460 [FCB group bacterium]|nr:hypothetical protein [FCB group bacterium]